MNRRFQNSLTALLASASALALCLALAVPAPHQAEARAVALQLGPVDFTFTPDAGNGNSSAQQVDALVRSIEHRAGSVDTLADAATLTAELATAAALARTLQDTHENAAIDSEKKQARTAARHRRQTLVMPYFSFAPRG